MSTTAKYEVYLKRVGKRGRWVPCSSSVEASKLVRQFIERDAGDVIGSSVWQGGDVRMSSMSKTLLYRVSYNGKVWDRREFPDCQEVSF